MLPDPEGELMAAVCCGGRRRALLCCARVHGCLSACNRLLAKRGNRRMNNKVAHIGGSDRETNGSATAGARAIAAIESERLLPLQLQQLMEMKEAGRVAVVGKSFGLGWRGMVLLALAWLGLDWLGLCCDALCSVVLRSVVSSCVAVMRCGVLR